MSTPRGALTRWKHRTSPYPTPVIDSRTARLDTGLGLRRVETGTRARKIIPDKSWKLPFDVSMSKKTVGCGRRGRCLRPRRRRRMPIQTQWCDRCDGLTRENCSRSSAAVAGWRDGRQGIADSSLWGCHVLSVTGVKWRVWGTQCRKGCWAAPSDALSRLRGRGGVGLGSAARVVRE